jgi:hypothetical protein
MEAKDFKSITLQAARALEGGEGKIILAVGPYVWGRGKTGVDALKACRREGAGEGDKVFFMRVPEGTQVNEMGSITYFPPEGGWDSVPDKDAYCTAEKLGMVRLKR